MAHLSSSCCGLQVYKATLGGVQTVAVKVFTDQASTEAASASKSEEFQREIAILKACRDKNIVTFIGASLQVGDGTMLWHVAEQPVPAASNFQWSAVEPCAWAPPHLLHAVMST